MDPASTSEIGATGVRVTRLGMGGAPLGGLFGDISEETAVQTVRRSYELGVRFFDTAPFYGHGKSERNFGAALAGYPAVESVLSTKIGRVLNPASSAPYGGHWANPLHFDPVFDFSRDGVLRSLDDSLERLGMDSVDILLIHDPDDHYEQAINEAYPALADLRSEGVVRAIGVGLSTWEALVRFAREGDFDCFLLAGRYTLLDQSGLIELLPLCVEKGISIILGGPYNTGILASDLSEETTYFNSRAPLHILDRARQVNAVCQRHGVPLKAAALQFGLAHPAIATTIPGSRTPLEAKENVQMAAYPIPTDLWVELKELKLLPEEAPMPSLN